MACVERDRNTHQIEERRRDVTGGITRYLGSTQRHRSENFLNNYREPRPGGKGRDRVGGAANNPTPSTLHTPGGLRGH